MSDAEARVREMLERIADESGVQAAVEVREDDNAITGTYVGDDLGLLIGQH